MYKIKAMVVEDEVLIRKLLIRSLERLSCEIVFETGYGEKAIEFAISEKPDIIFMDIKLQGGINGLEAVEKISESVDIPTILVSAYNYDDELSRMKAKKNIIGFFEKPVMEDKLEVILDKIRKNKKI